MYAVEGQDEEGVFAATDGTYKLHYGGWVLIALGSYRTRFSADRKYRKNFVPWAYAFARTEHQFAYETLFQKVKYFAHLLFSVDLNVRYGSLDHCASIANAFKAVWPSIILLDCYPHVARKCQDKEHLKRLKDPDFFKNNIAVSIVQLHHARSNAQFSALQEMIVQFWRDCGEDDYSDWFHDTYLVSRWKRWHVSSAIPGILSSQNALESHNRAIKTCGVEALRAKTGVVLNHSIPGVFGMAAQDAPTEAFGHGCGGPLSSEKVSRAMQHIRPGSYYIKKRKVNHKIVTRAMFFNSSAYMTITSGQPAVDVTLTRVNRYLRSKEGKLDDGDTVHDINLHYQSLHEVTFLETGERAANFKLKLEPIISDEQIKEIRSLYRCDCKSFWNTGWLCSHVIAAMALTNQFSIKSALSILPVRKASGGQRKVPGALIKDDAFNKTFSKSRLIKKLETDFLYCCGWNVADYTTRTDEVGTEVKTLRLGAISGYDQEGIGSWTVTFIDHAVMHYKLEELVDMIIASRQAGLDVTAARGKPNSAGEVDSSLHRLRLSCGLQGSLQRYLGNFWWYPVLQTC